MLASRNIQHIIITLLFMAGAVIPAQTCQAGSDQNSTGHPLSERLKEYTIGTGDILEISVWKEEDLSKTYAVRMDGRISVPLLGDILVNNKTISELTKHLEEKFQSVVTAPTVSIILVESRSRRYYVIGQVAHSGEFNLNQPITALQAIAKSGGFLEWAKKDKIKIIRKQGNTRKIIHFNYEALASEGDLSQDQLLEPGDTVIVP